MKMSESVKENKSNTENHANPLGTAPIGKLLLRFAIPSIIAMLVSSLYNMVDQIFIGNNVGDLGNAATNIAFPLTMLCTATALTFGIGGAASFNLSMGAGEKDRAGYYIGNAFSGMFMVSVVIMLVSEIFLMPLMNVFGSPKSVLPFACEYTRVTAFGFPLLVLSIGGGHLIRADGKPTVAMLCNLIGAIVNTALDALFVVVFQWGMTGAAVATVIGQAVATGLIIYHLARFRTIPFKWKYLVPKGRYLGRTASLGMSQGFNQLAMMVVQIVLNNSLKYYGGLSVFGESIPITVVGVSTKINMIYFSFCIGFSQAMQPIASYNYGAQKFDRVKKIFRLTWTCGAVVSLISFALFQIFPSQLVSIFGSGSKEYFDFAIMYFRIYLFTTFVNNVQPLSSTFFSSIGQPVKGLILSLTRQILFLLPLILILPVFFGIDGIMYAGPIADGAAFICAAVMVVMELRKPKYRKN